MVEEDKQAAEAALVVSFLMLLIYFWLAIVQLQLVVEEMVLMGLPSPLGGGGAYNGMNSVL